MNTATELRQKVLSLLEFRFDMIPGKNAKRIGITSGDLDRAGIKLEDLAEALYFFEIDYPSIKKIWVYDFINEDTPSEPRELDVKYHTLATIEVPADFKTLLARIRKDMSIPDNTTRLAGMEVKFDKTKSQLLFDGIVCELPPQGNEWDLCVVLFARDIGEHVGWEVVAKQTTGDEVSDVKFMRPVRDAVYAINRRVQRELRTNDHLFGWKNKGIVRNF